MSDSSIMASTQYKTPERRLGERFIQVKAAAKSMADIKGADFPLNVKQSSFTDTFGIRREGQGPSASALLTC